MSVLSDRPPKLLESVEARAEVGRAARLTVPRTVHGEWAPAADRPDPVTILEEQARSRVQELLPIRYGRMSTSPFALYRGAAAVMASDLSKAPNSGIIVQACGDAHASNFGIFATPERDLAFDVNDFDETLPGPWEVDVKRLSASLAIAARHRNIPRRQRQEIVTAAVRSYRTAMRDFATMGHLAIWYSRLDTISAQRWRAQLTKRQISKVQVGAAKARSKDSLRALSKLTVEIDGAVRFASAPPLLVPLRDLTDSDEAALLDIERLLDAYAKSLRPELRHLFKTYRLVDIARKVVGVGSVGTRAWIVLLEGRDGQDPLILQAKEAQASVLEAYVGESRFTNHGERVVVGQRLMQSASDIFLGWVRLKGIDGQTRDFYVRQLWDWKGSLDLETVLPSALNVYGEMCGWTLARAHARSGDPVAIGAYLGSSDQFDRAISRFAEAYADQNERDYARLAAAVKEGRVTALSGV